MKLTKAAFVLLGLIWGSNFIYMKWASVWIGPMQIVFLRAMFRFMPLAPAAWRQKVIHRSQARYLPHFFIMAAVATALYYVAIVKGTALLPSGIAGALGGSIAIFTAIFSLLFLRTEKLNRLMATGVQDWRAAAGVVIGLGILGTGVAYLFYYFLLKELGAVAASGATYITPIVALLIGWVAGEKVGVLEIAAIGLILASIAMLQIGQQRSARATRQPERTATARP